MGLAASTEADPAIVSAASIGSGKMSGPVSAANTNCVSRAGAIREQFLNNAELWGLDRIDTVKDRVTRSLNGRYRHSSQGTGVHVFVADTGILVSGAGGRTGGWRQAETDACGFPVPCSVVTQSLEAVSSCLALAALMLSPAATAATSMATAHTTVSWLRAGTESLRQQFA